MHSLVNRLSALFSFTCQVIAVCVVANMITGYLFKTNAKADVTINRLTGFQVGEYRNYETELATFSFNLDVDFTSLFHWNTKFVYLCVTARHKTKSTVYDEVVVWDKIIKPNEAKFSEKNMRFKYPLTDDYRNLRNGDIEFTTKWMVMPLAGFFSIKQGEGKHFTMPADYLY